jgi:hypothetical protein
MIETDYVWMRAPPAPPRGAKPVAFHFHYINPGVRAIRAYFVSARVLTRGAAVPGPRVGDQQDVERAAGRDPVHWPRTGDHHARRLGQAYA